METKAYLGATWGQERVPIQKLSYYYNATWQSLIGSAQQPSVTWHSLIGPRQQVGPTLT
jgi:hypothetical protein